MLVIFWHGILFYGQAGLSFDGKCNCGPEIVNPTATQALQFFFSDIFPSGAAECILETLSMDPVPIHVKSGSGLAFAIWLYKTGIPAVTGKYYVDQRQLRRALKAAPKELQQLEKEFKGSCILADGQSIERSLADLAPEQKQPRRSPNFSVA